MTARVSRRRLLAGLTLALPCAAVTSFAGADRVRVGTLARIPFGIDPSHPQAGEVGGASRAGQLLGRVPATAPSLSWPRQSADAAHRRSPRAREPVVQADGTIVVATPDGLVAFDAAGTPRSMPMPSVEASPALLPGGGYVALGRIGDVVIASPTLEPLERILLGAGLSNAPLVLDDGSFVLTCSDRTVRRLDRSLREIFRFELTEGPPRAATRDGDRLAITHGAALTFADLDGHVERSIPLGDRAIGPAARGDDGTIWVTLANGEMVSVVERRRIARRLSIGTRVEHELPAIATDGSLRVAARQRGVACFDANGERWVCETGRSFDGAVRVDATGATLAIDREPSLVAIEPDGARRWRVNLPEHGWSGPVVDRRGRVIVVGSLGLVMVLG